MALRLPSSDELYHDAGGKVQARRPSIINQNAQVIGQNISAIDF